MPQRFLAAYATEVAALQAQGRLPHGGTRSAWSRPPGARAPLRQKFLASTPTAKTRCAFSVKAVGCSGLHLGWRRWLLVLCERDDLIPRAGGSRPLVRHGQFPPASPPCASSTPPPAGWSQLHRRPRSPKRFSRCSPELSCISISSKISAVAGAAGVQIHQQRRLLSRQLLEAARSRPIAASGARTATQ